MFNKLIFLGDSHTSSSMRNRLEKAPHRPAPDPDGVPLGSQEHFAIKLSGKAAMQPGLRIAF